MFKIEASTNKVQGVSLNRKQSLVHSVIIFDPK